MFNFENILAIIAIIVSVASIIVVAYFSYKQNKIALFEKRYDAFQLFERCVSFAKSLETSETLDDMKKDCMAFFDDLKCEELNIKMIKKKVFQFEYRIHQMEFLFKRLDEQDCNSLYTSLWNVMIAIIENEEVDIHRNNYINTISKFAKKYNKIIWSKLRL